jgi:hypothetical protein
MVEALNAEVQNETRKLLSMDEKVDELDDIEVKDAWSRGQLMQRIIKRHEDGFMYSEECDKLESWLKSFDNAGLIEVAIHGFGRTHSLVYELCWENGPHNVEVLFDRLTKDDMSEEELVSVARRQLKTGLRGSGMPRIRIYRARVRCHTEGE